MSDLTYDEERFLDALKHRNGRATMGDLIADLWWPRRKIASVGIALIDRGEIAWSRRAPDDAHAYIRTDKGKRA